MSNVWFITGAGRGTIRGNQTCAALRLLVQ